MAHSVRASHSTLCRVDRQQFKSRSLLETFFPVTFTLYSISSHSQPGKIADGEGRDKDKRLAAF